MFVTFNDQANDTDADTRVDEEIIRKVILPNARSYCRLKGSDYSGREFITGEGRNAFQEGFQESLTNTCLKQNIRIVQVAITSITPPDKIRQPVQERQIAVQNEKRFVRETLQQESEKDLAVQKQLIQQRQEMVEADREVVKIVTEAERNQEVALIEAKQRLNVATLRLEAAKDLAAAELARGKAEADVIRFQNEAVAAGWRKAVESFDGNGQEFARWVMFQKIAPAFRQMMVNTADSPIMQIFEQYRQPSESESVVRAGNRPTAAVGRPSQDPGRGESKPAITNQAPANATDNGPGETEVANGTATAADPPPVEVDQQ